MRDAQRLVDDARNVLDNLPNSPLGAVESLGQARSLIDEALNEAMAHAILAGSSIRAVAAKAGLSPNAVPPRLARTGVLSRYADDEARVMGSSIARARFDFQPGSNPRQRPTGKGGLSAER